MFNTVANLKEKEWCEMNGCFYCEKNASLTNLMIPVCELNYSNVYIVKNQNYPGRCVVAYKEHKQELYELSAAELSAFTQEVAAVAKAIAEHTKADKINYAIYGDGVPHLHYHVVPKKKELYGWGSPFALSGNDLFPSAAELQATAKLIKDRIMAVRI